MSTIPPSFNPAYHEFTDPMVKSHTFAGRAGAPQPASQVHEDRYQAGNEAVKPPGRADLLRLVYGQTAPATPTGKGIGVFVADVEDIPGHPSHRDAVKGVVEKGAPGTTIARAEFNRSALHDLKLPDGGLQSMAGEVDKYIATPYLSAIRMLDRVKGERVVNISFGTGLEFLYSRMYQKLSKGKQGPLDEKLAREVIGFVQKRMEDPGGPAAQARQKYRDKVAKLAARGVTVVVAGGNAKMTEKGQQEWNRLDPGCLGNLLAEPKDLVISVGAVDKQGKPTKEAAPSIPTLAAVSVSDNLGGGSSFAAPYVVATIAQMLEVNPKLTTAQIRQILLASSQPNGQDAQYVGAGQLNRERAVQAARALASPRKAP